MTNKNPIPPLSNPITNEPVSLIWSAFFSNLKNYIDTLGGAVIAITHNALDGLQGGNSTERYHFTRSEHATLEQVPAFNGDTNQFLNGNALFSQPDHAQLDNLQGGVDGQRYHLLLSEVNKINSIPVGNGNPYQFFNGLSQWSTPTHNLTTGLQGGAAGDYQHLTTHQVGKVKNMESLIFGYITLGL